MKSHSASLHSDRGATLVELMAAVVILGIVSIGIFKASIGIAQHMVRDKLVNDMYVFGQMVMDETVRSLEASSKVQTGSNSGGRGNEELEFEFLGVQNVGFTQETRFSRSTDETLEISDNQGAVGFVRNWPPIELDRDRFDYVDQKIEIIDYKVTSYNDRPAVDSFVGRNLYEVVLKLRLTDESMNEDWVIEREFKRIVFAPNIEIRIMREQQALDNQM